MRGAVLGCARYPDEDSGGIQNQSTISNIYEDEVLEPLVQCTERKVNAVPKTIIICGRRIRSVARLAKQIAKAAVRSAWLLRAPRGPAVDRWPCVPNHCLVACWVPTTMRVLCLPG